MAMRLTRKQIELLGRNNDPKEKAVHMKAIETAGGRSVSAANKLFDAMCEANGLPLPDHEVEFALELGRKWRFDHLFDGWLALEVQGGNWINGRHTRAGNLKDEYEKLNTAVLLGYATIFCTPEDVTSGEAFALVKRVLNAEAEQS